MADDLIVKKFRRNGKVVLSIDVAPGTPIAIIQERVKPDDPDPEAAFDLTRTTIEIEVSEADDAIIRAEAAKPPPGRGRA